MIPTNRIIVILLNNAFVYNLNCFLLIRFDFRFSNKTSPKHDEYNLCALRIGCNLRALHIFRVWLLHRLDKAPGSYLDIERYSATLASLVRVLDEVDRILANIKRDIQCIFSV